MIKKKTARRTGKKKKKKRPEDMGDLPGRMTMSSFFFFFFFLKKKKGRDARDRQSRVVLLKVRNGISSYMYSLPFFFVSFPSRCFVARDVRLMMMRGGRKRQAGRLAGFFCLFSRIYPVNGCSRNEEEREENGGSRLFFCCVLSWFALN